MFAGLASCKEKHIAKGDCVFRQGDSVEHVYVIRRGRLKLMRTTMDGNSVVLQMALAGDMLAEASLFFDTYHCTAIADTAAVEIACFSTRELLAACRESATVAMQLAALFAHRIRKLRAILEIRNIRSASQRIYAYLQFEAGAERKVQLNMTYKDMAYQLGLEHETLYRAMKQLE